MVHDLFRMATYYKDSSCVHTCLIYLVCTKIEKTAKIFTTGIFKLHHGDSEIDQLFRIFRTLGTPNNEVWPEVESLPDYKNTFPKWKSGNLALMVKNLDKNGVDLLAKMLTFNPPKRISAREAMTHPYFDDLDKSTLPAAMN